LVNVVTLIVVMLSLFQNRQLGFYWVKTASIEGIQTGVWQTGFFNGEGWQLCGYEGVCYDEFIAEIADKINCPYQPTRDST
jgi:hypothetical protein